MICFQAEHEKEHNVYKESSQKFYCAFYNKNI